MNTTRRRIQKARRSAEKLAAQEMARREAADRVRRRLHNLFPNSKARP